MALGLFLPGLDKPDDIIEIRNQVIETLKAGNTVVTAWSSENTSVTKTQGMSLTQILEECNYFLQQVGIANRRITRTHAQFY